MGLSTRQQRKMHDTRRQLTVWFAAFALIDQILMPFAQAMAFDANQGIEYQVICTANGIKQIPIDQNGTPIEPVDLVTCSSCVMHVAPVLLTPQLSTQIIIEEPVEHAAFGLPVQITQASIWRSSLRPSRAPPHII